jgi:hypothetical protein
VPRAQARTPLAAELLVVLAVFPLPAAVSAVGVLVAELQLRSGLPSGTSLDVIHGPWLWALVQATGTLTELAGTALVCYLLLRSGEGVGAIGLGGRKLRLDLALALPVFVAVQYIPQTFGNDLVRWLGLRGFFPDLRILLHAQGPAAITAVQVVAGVAAGVVEEVVVLGFLVRRLEQLGLRPVWVVLIAVAVRVSYHLYYGWEAIAIAMWALASVLVYRWVRRLLPFILCHIAWDVGLAVGLYYRAAFGLMVIVLFLGSACVTLLWGRRPAGSAAGNAAPGG